jgi:hypothetical protein
MNRGRFQGVTQIVRFNWPFYAIATILVIATAVIATQVTGAARVVIVIAAAIAAYWMIASLVASYWIYDLSPLRDWKWIREALTAPRPATWLNLHAGIDESTPDVRALFPDSSGRSLDFFDVEVMTEPSIRRARRLAHNMEPSEAVDFRRLPAGDASQEAAFLLLSAHELRRHDDRVALLREVHRVIAPGGRAIVAEHLRDPANFLAFGPGFLHFHSRRTWLRAFADAGVVVESSFRITPFIAVFVLRRSS